MLLIPCPWCGPRDDIEFRYGGEAHIARPADPDGFDDSAWAEYLFMRSNPKGVFAERWVHSAGCRRWFNLLRDTASHRVLAAYRIGEPPPARPPRRWGSPCASRGAAGSTASRCCISVSTTANMRAIRAIRWPRPYWPMACGWSAAASNTIARAAS